MSSALISIVARSTAFSVKSEFWSNDNNLKDILDWYRLEVDLVWYGLMMTNFETRKAGKEAPVVLDGLITVFLVCNLNLGIFSSYFPSNSHGNLIH